MDTSRHVGRIAIITGVGNGIGRATILRMAAEGAKCIGLDVAPDALEETKKLLAAQGLSAELLVADVTKQEDIDRVMAAAGERVDILANVAGIMDAFLPIGDVDDATWDRVIAVNLTGVMRLSRACVRVMEQQGHGAIVTVASKASVGAGASGVAYTASKHGVIGLVKSISYYYGPKGIRSNAVLPGAVATNIGTSSVPKVPWAMERAMLSMAVMNPKPAEPDQIATAISWLASDEASNVNGALMLDDGGWASA